MNTTTSDHDDIERDVSLDPEDRQRIRRNQEWLKMTKGQTLLGAFVYFHPVDVSAVMAVRKANKNATPDEMKAAARKALTDRASALQKSVDDLAAEEKLELGTVQFKTCKAHYQEGVGFALSRLGKDGPDADAVWKKLPEAHQYFSTLLLLYPMTREGRRDIEAIRRGEWRILPWRFGPSIYNEIWNLNDGLRGNGMSIANQDVRLSCTDATFQRIKVSFVGQALWQSNEAFKRKILAAAIPLYDKLVPFREVSTDQLREKLGIGGKTVGTVVSEDFTGLLDSV